MYVIVYWFIVIICDLELLAKKIDLDPWIKNCQNRQHCNYFSNDEDIEKAANGGPQQSDAGNLRIRFRIKRTQPLQKTQVTFRFARNIEDSNHVTQE
jgi:hypothetical protein